MNRSELDTILAAKYPGYRPLASAPSLFTFNGIGLKLYGERDRDPDTGCHVATLCFTLIFIPVLTLKSYVVCEVESNSWSFFGTVPLSNLAKRWNYAVCCLVLALGCAIGWENHKESAGYRAGELVQKGDAHWQSRQFVEAAQAYVDAIRMDAGTAPEARVKLGKILGEALGDPDTAVSMQAFRFALRLPPEFDQPTPLVPGLSERAVAASVKMSAKAPGTAIELLETLASSRFKTPEAEGLIRTHLESWVKAEPSNVEPAVRLALLLEGEKNTERCLALLEPLAGKLEGGEGARILGQIYAAADRFDEAYPLLTAHVRPRMKQLSEAEGRLQKASDLAEAGILDSLRKGRALGFNYSAYEKASQTEKDRLVNEYFVKQLDANPAYQSALLAYQKCNEVLPVVMDLGITQLRRGQSASNPADRQKELLAAEQTFLSLQTAAGESDSYRMFLGQVYYWLGRHGEGRALFEALLESKKRAHGILLQLADTLRDVGEDAASREMVDEAYAKSKTDDERYAAASFRTLLCLTPEERLAWYRKCKPGDPHTEIGIHTSQGEVDSRDGREAEAISHYKNALKAYEQLVKSSSTLNNSALVHLQLYRLSGQAQHQTKAGELLLEAVALQPNNSILMNNAGDALVNAAYAETHAANLSPLVIRVAGGEAFRLTYDSKEEYDRLASGIVESPSHRKGVALIEKASLLAPKSQNLVSSVCSLNHFARNQGALEEILQRVTATEFDGKDADAMRERYRKGEFDSSARQSSLSRGKKLADALSKAGTQKEKGQILSLILDNELDLCVLDQLPVTDQHKAKAREALNLAPCSLARANQRRVLVLRLSQQLAEKRKPYAEWVSAHRRDMSHQDLLQLALDKEELGEALRSLPEFREWTTLVMENENRYPDSTDASVCLLAKVVGHPSAAVLLERWQNDRLNQVAAEINSRLNPRSVTTTLHRYRELLLKGKREEALKTYREAKAQGVTLPDLGG